MGVLELLEKKENCSVINKISLLDPGLRAKLYKSLSDKELLTLKYSWPLWARPNQIPPNWNWSTWLILAGRGYGKTRSATELVRQWAESNDVSRIRIIGADAGDCRDVLVEGPSGILSISRPDFRPSYEPSKKKITWPNGCVANLFSAEDPEELRGPEHEKALCDEIAKWKYMDETWNQHLFGMRVGKHPQTVAPTTPKPRALIKKLLAQENKNVAVTRGTTYENKINLADSFFTDIIKAYEGTHLGKQELEGVLLDEVPGALWSRETIEKNRVTEYKELKRIVITIDPAITSKSKSNKTGIVACGISETNHGYVLADKSLIAKPEKWGKIAIDLFHELQADLIIAEGNQGGEMVKSVIQAIDYNVPIKIIWASRGKHVRAEPISLKYEQGLIHHVGTFDALEDQMCNYTSDSRESPDNMDAMVHGMTNLFHRGAFIL